MNPEQQRSILAIALFAAFADGAKHDREREEIRRIAESLGGEAGAPDLARLYQDVLLKRISLGAATAALQDPGERQLAYEMAVCVCDADGRQSAAEQRFLAELKGLLKLDAETAVLKDTFQNLLGPAKQMQTQYLPQIQQQASTLDAAQIMAMVRGG
jgi:tellurite resistance protein